MASSIDWQVFDPEKSDNIPEVEYLIFINGLVVQAMHKPLGRMFLRYCHGGDIFYSYQDVTHYAEFNVPKVKL